MGSARAEGSKVRGVSQSATRRLGTAHPPALPPLRGAGDLSPRLRLILALTPLHSRELSPPRRPFHQALFPKISASVQRTPPPPTLSSVSTGAWWMACAATRERENTHFERRFLAARPQPRADGERGEVTWEPGAAAHRDVAQQRRRLLRRERRGRLRRRRQHGQAPAVPHLQDVPAEAPHLLQRDLNHLRSGRRTTARPRLSARRRASRAPFSPATAQEGSPPSP